MEPTPVKARRRADVAVEYDLTQRQRAPDSPHVADAHGATVAARSASGLEYRLGAACHNRRMDIMQEEVLTDL